MAKAKTIFVCSNCGFESSRWLGRCGECNSWNTMLETSQSGLSAKRATKDRLSSPRPLSEISPLESPRLTTGSSELDQVLGGGLVPGSSVLLGGEPGIGKSTILLQTADHLAGQGRTVLYVSAEESPNQIALRARRLELSSGHSIQILAEGRLSLIEDAITRLKPELVILDSIQAVQSELLTSAPGTVSQVRDSAWSLTELCQSANTVLIMAGHVTKEGSLAGPKTLEHMVDSVLYFEGQRDRELRLIRCVKNRFGNINEIAVFLMNEKGLIEVNDPAGVFLSSENLLEGLSPKGPGSMITASLEGNRVFLAEIQILITHRIAGNLTRTTDGVDANRVMRVRAILESRLGIDLFERDVFVNITGGLTINEPASELAIAAAIYGSLKQKTPETPVLVLGEIGLLGDLRRISQAGKRVNQAAKLGLKTIVLPEANRREFESQTSGERPGPTKIELIFATTLEEVLKIVFG